MYSACDWGGMSEHVHVVISIPPKLSVATLIGRLKGASSHHVNHNHAAGSFGWQAEYGALSFAEKALPSIVDYVNHQKKHHTENTLNQSMENSAP